MQIRSYLLRAYFSLLCVVLTRLVSVLLTFTYDFVPTSTKIKLRQLNFDPDKYVFIIHVAMVILVNDILQSICHIVNR